MLDDIKRITNRDRDNALRVVEHQPDQLLHSFGVQAVDKEVSAIVVAGMGGSAIAARMSYNWPQPNMPLTITQSYQLPAFASKSTLCILSSYSGNTEEVLAVYKQAIERGCRIVVITSGGELEQRARENNHQFIMIPAGLQPRYAVWYMFRAFAEVYVSIGAVNDVVRELEESAEWVRSEIAAWRPDQPTSRNLAKRLAQDVAGNTPVIYAGSELSSAAYKWKINFNENAKNLAFSNVIPELNHNEMIGWTSHPVQKLFQPIELRSTLYHPHVQKRFVAMDAALSGQMPHPITIDCAGNTVLRQLLWSIALGDFTSIYLAVLNNVDPTQVDLVERFKKSL